MTNESKHSAIEIVGILFGIGIAVALLVGLLNLIDLTGVFKTVGKTAPHMWVGAILFLFLSTIHEVKIEAIIKYVPGAIGGILTGFLISPAFEATVGINLAVICFFIVLIFAIVCMIIGKLQSIVNSCFMLFLTICTIPQVSDDGYHFSYIIVLLISAVYFSGIIYLGHLISSKNTEVT